MRARSDDAVVVTGAGVLSAAGDGLQATVAALRAGRSGLHPARRLLSARLGALPVAEVTEDLGAGTPRTVALAHRAVEQACVDAGLDSAARRATALVLGTTVGGMPETEEALHVRRCRPAGGGGGHRESGGPDGPSAPDGPNAPDASDGPDAPGSSAPGAAEVWRRHAAGAVTASVADASGLGGPVSTVSTACASGAQAIAMAADMIRSGLVDRAVAGGVDVLCRLTLHGFASLMVLDPEGCRPFDRARRGTSLGEGAAFVVLERLDTARARAATPHATLAGWGHACDAHHATAPDPEGRGAADAMRRALDMAGLDPADITWVNAHGTGTLDNDRAEGRALRDVFGKELPLVSSLKRTFGHTLGAAGAIEAVASVLALRGGFVPGTPGLREPDPECLVEPLRETIDGPCSAVLSNSFGFGGHDTVLCLTAAAAERGP